MFFVLNSRSRPPRVGEGRENARALLGCAALLRSVDELDLFLVLDEVVTHDLPIALELGRTRLLEERAHPFVDLLQLLDELPEEREVAGRTIFAREMAAVAGEDEIRRGRLDGE